MFLIESGVLFAIMFVVLVFIILLIYIATRIRIVNQSYEFVIERLGTYKETWTAGVHFLTPFVDRIANKVSLKEQVSDFDPQSVITKDNVSISVDTVVFYKVTDSKKYTYGVSNPVAAIDKLTTTTLRQQIGNLTLDETLTSRDTINMKIQTPVDLATDAWGIKIIRLELKDIDPPREIQTAMEKQMKAEREKRQAILLAEGDKQAMITKAEGEKEAAINKAEGEKEATILRADALAEQVKKAADAEAYAIEALKKAGADERVIQLKSLEALAKLAEGNATKIVVPSDLQNLTKVVSAVEVIKDTK